MLSEMYRSFKGKGRIGESWETSVESIAEAITIDGENEVPFSAYLTRHGLGAPPLVKLLDADSPLSIQIHPDEKAAHFLGGVSKSEIWYVLSAHEDAHILYGTKKGISLTEAIDAIFNGNIETVLNKIFVKPGDIFMIPPGMIHSLGGGITVLEIQNNAGTTYRIKDIAGNREIHVSESIECLKIYSDEQIKEYRTAHIPYNIGKVPGEIIVCADGYTVGILSSSKCGDVAVSSGTYMFCENGCGSCCGVDFEKGDSIFFPVPSSMYHSSDSSLIFVK